MAIYGYSIKLLLKFLLDNLLINYIVTESLNNSNNNNNKNVEMDIYGLASLFDTTIASITVSNIECAIKFSR